MPTVPYSQGPTVGQAPTPSLRAPAESFGVGQRPVDLGPTADIASTIAARSKERADQIAVVDAGSKLSALETQLLHDPKTGVLNQRGKNAFGAATSVSETWDKQTADLESSLTNDDQKAVFRRLQAQHKAALDEQVTRHVAAETETYDQQSTAALISNEQAAGVAGTPERAELAIDNQRAVLTGYADRQGWSPEQTKEHIDQAVSKTRFGVLERMVNSEQDIAATKYLNDHRSEFVGSDLLQAEKLTDAGSTRAESQRQSDDITSKATTLGEALHQVQLLTDPRVRDATEARVRRFYADQGADLREQRAQSFDKVSQMLEQNGGDVHSLPVADLLNLTPEQHTAIEARAEKIRHPKVETNVATYTHLINMAGLSDASREEFQKINFSDPKYTGNLSESDWHHVVELQRQMRTGELKAAAADEKRDEAKSERATTSLHRREEATVIKQSEAGARDAKKRADALATAKAMGLKIPEGAAPPAAKVTVPKWMTDSAATDSEYHDYLTLHNVKGLPPKPSADAKPDSPVPTLPPAPKVPGGPIGDIDLRKMPTAPKAKP